METKFTKGPWKAAEGLCGPIVCRLDDEQHTIAVMTDQCPDTEEWGNAQLLAAAPALLEALEECLPMLTGQHLRMVGHPLGDGTTERLHRIHALIAKAKGEEA